jgi:hypothetical protein
MVSGSAAPLPEFARTRFRAPFNERKAPKEQEEDGELTYVLSVDADGMEATDEERRRRLGFTPRGGSAHKRHSGFERARWRRLGAAPGLYSLGAELKKVSED